MKIRNSLFWIVTVVGLFPLFAEPVAAANETAKANNAFAVDLYSQLAKEPGNLVVSPFSIDTALTMAYAGARGNTAKQMADVLHFANRDAGGMLIEFNADHSFLYFIRHNPTGTILFMGRVTNPQQ